MGGAVGISLWYVHSALTGTCESVYTRKMSNRDKTTVKKTLTWSKENVQRFLELFEQYPCLYDTRHAFYANKHARAEALDKIRVGVDLPGVTIDDIKTKINNVRSQVAQELKKQREERSGMGADEKHEPVWWFPDAQFLVPYMRSRQGRATLEQTHVEHTESESRIEDDAESVGSSLTASERSEPPAPSQGGMPKKRKMLREQASCEDTGDLISTLKALKESVNELGREGLPEQDFANYIANEVAGIDDVALRLECKHAITTVMYEYKKKWLQKTVEITYVME